MTDNLDDGFEGGYIASAKIPPEQLEKMRRQRPEMFVTDDIDDQYDEAMKLFGGEIPKIGEPTEYIVTDKDMIEKYGHIPDLNNMVAVDEEPDD